MNLKDRMNRLEAAAKPKGAGITLFKHQSGAFISVATGKTYTEDAYVALVGQHPDRLFLCVDETPEEDPLKNLTLDDLRSGKYDELIEERRRQEEEDDKYWEPIIRDIRRRMGDTTVYDDPEDNRWDGHEARPALGI